MVDELEEMSSTEWHGIADWLEKELSKTLGHEFDSLFWDHSVEKNRLSNGTWSIPATQIAFDECGFFVYCPVEALDSGFELVMTELQKYLATLKIDWTVFCYEQRWAGTNWECALNPAVVISKAEIERDLSRFLSCAESNESKGSA
jgi:hypothetical protein